MYLAPTIFLLLGIQLSTSTPEGIVERVGGWCLMWWAGTVGSPALRLRWQQPSEESFWPNRCRWRRASPCGGGTDSRQVLQEWEEERKKGGGRRRKGNFRSWLMLYEKWSVVGSANGREECSCSCFFFFLCVFMLLCGRGSASPDWGRMGTQRRPPWGGDLIRDWNDEIQPLCQDLWEERSSRGNKLQESWVRFLTHVVSRWFLWDTNESLRFGWYLLESKSMTDGQMPQGEVRNPRQVVV